MGGLLCKSSRHVVLQGICREGKTKLMKTLRSFFCALCALSGLMLASISQADACTSTQLEVGNDCIDSKFTVTTTNMSANTTFKFVLTATGTFYVDWGDGSTVETIFSSLYGCR